MVPCHLRHAVGVLERLQAVDMEGKAIHKLEHVIKLHLLLHHLVFVLAQDGKGVKQVQQFVL